MESKAGMFLDSLIELCKENPEYLHPQDALRYRFLLSMLKQFVFKPWNREDCVSVANATIQQMRKQGLQSWVASYVRVDSPVYKDVPREPYGLMPHYVLDAALFVLKHLHGFFGGFSSRWSNESRSFRIEPMVANAPEDFRLFESPSFKSDFTRNVPAIFTRGLVPQGASIRVWRYGNGNQRRTTALYQSGDSFWFSVSRCHLSSGVYDYSDAEVEYNQPEYDISEDFVLYGNILEELTVRAGYLQGLGEHPAFIPGRWLKHSFRTLGRRHSGEDSIEPETAPWDISPLLQ